MPPLWPTEDGNGSGNEDANGGGMADGMITTKMPMAAAGMMV